MPVFAGALYSLVALGAVAAAGSEYGNATDVAPPWVQVTFVSHVGAAGAEAKPVQRKIQAMIAPIRTATNPAGKPRGRRTLPP